MDLLRRQITAVKQQQKQATDRGPSRARTLRKLQESQKHGGQSCYYPHSTVEAEAKWVMKLAQSLGAGNWQSWNLNLNSLTPPPQKGAEFSKGIPRVRPKATMNLIHRVSPVHKPLWLHDSIGPHNYLMRVVLCDSSPHSPREDTNHQRESELELDDKYGPLPPQPWTWGMTSPLPEEDGSWWMLRLTVDPPRLHGCSRLQPPAGLFHGSLHLKMHRIRMRVFKLSPLAHSRLPEAKAQTPLAPSPDAAKCLETVLQTLVETFCAAGPVLGAVGAQRQEITAPDFQEPPSCRPKAAAGSPAQGVPDESRAAARPGGALACRPPTRSPPIGRAAFLRAARVTHGAGSSGTPARGMRLRLAWPRPEACSRWFSYLENSLDASASNKLVSSLAPQQAGKPAEEAPSLSVRGFAGLI
ncbi:uncharacterized protein [Symphalangus syndactylus]|uniref:uncharacterized protein n=1 Tax=Symphalangus syndactylus TaxID=9590 RepID=UPI0030041690